MTGRENTRWKKKKRKSSLFLITKEIFSFKNKDQKKKIVYVSVYLFTFEACKHLTVMYGSFLKRWKTYNYTLIYPS